MFDEDDYVNPLEICAFGLFGVVVDAREGGPVQPVCGGRSMRVDREALPMKMRLFRGRHERLDENYTLKGCGNHRVLESFMRLVSGNDVEGTICDYTSLGCLCREFGFDQKCSFRLSLDVMSFGLERALKEEMRKTRNT